MFNFIINKKIPLQQKIFIFISSQLANCNQIQHMLIQFERPECPKHKRPFQFLCMTQDCPCQIRLCAACINSHCKKYGKSDFMKDGHFYKKLQMQCEIIDKQYSFLEKHFSKEMGSSLLSNKKQENFKMVELIMKVVSQDEKAVKRAIDQFCFSVEERRQKISSLYNTDQRSFLKFIQFPIPMQIMIKMASNKGLERIWKKIIECQGTTKKYKQILQELQRYGNTAESFYMGLRFRKVLLKDDIKKLINHSPTEVKAITNEIERRQTTVKRITNNDQNTKKLSFTPNPYAASPRSPRKFTIFSNENRPRTNTNLDRIK